MWDGGTIFVLIAALCCLILSTSADVGYDEVCNDKKPCQKSPGLTCSRYNNYRRPKESRCRCATDKMTFDRERNLCAADNGEKCRYESDEVFNITIQPEEYGPSVETVIIYEPVVDCIKGSICNEEGICECEHRLRVDENNDCGARKNFRFWCDIQDDCNHLQMLACVENEEGQGHCQCFVGDEMYFDSATQICRLKIGRKCADLSSHYPNASVMAAPGTSPKAWNYVLESFSRAPCPIGSTCDANTGQCSFLCNPASDRNCTPCPPNQYVSNFTAGTCDFVKEKGESCTSSEDCNPKNLLSCVNSKCDCDPELTVNAGQLSSGHGSSTDCLAKVGVRCNVGRGLEDFVSYVRCVNFASCVDGICKCDDRFKTTRDKMCGRIYDQTCTLDMPCLDYLVCTEGKCRCPDEDYQVHDSNASADRCSGICRYRGLAGMVCDPQTSNTTSSVTCVENADCIADSHEESGGFICKCRTGFVKSSSDHCEVAHGWPCQLPFIHGGGELPVPCDQVAGLKCRAVKQRMGNSTKTEFVQLCSCPNLSDLYDEKVRKCVKRANSGCSNQSTYRNESATCIRNSSSFLNFHYQTGWCIAEDERAPPS